MDSIFKELKLVFLEVIVVKKCSSNVLKCFFFINLGVVRIGGFYYGYFLFF